jgi:hypothetical protein
MLVGLLIVLLIKVGCAGPVVDQTCEAAESYRQACRSHLLPPEREQASLKEYPFQAIWWGWSVRR